MDYIKVKGARENNLKDVDCTFPKNKLVVLTGVSGSGKTSFAFDTIYKEGQRRYLDSLSSYARQFIGDMDKPDVDNVEGLSPAISIDQKSGSKNPRSTVGTVTEIADYLRLLFARIGKPYCPTHHIPIEPMSIDEIIEIVKEYDAKREKNQIGVHSVRGGNIVGVHTVKFIGMSDELEITHRAQSRDMFAEGSLKAAKWLIENNNQTGLFNMNNMD